MVYIRVKENQERHDIGVANWARKVISAGWSFVQSDLPNNTKPSVIGGFVPDIYAAHNGQEYVIEVETLDSVNTEHALSQKAAFQAWVNARPASRRFEIKMA